MRCKICNEALKGLDLTRKDKKGNFLDICGNCMEVVYKTNEEFIHTRDVYLLTNVAIKS